MKTNSCLDLFGGSTFSFFARTPHRRKTRKLISRAPNHLIPFCGGPYDVEVYWKNRKTRKKTISGPVRRKGTFLKNILGLGLYAPSPGARCVHEI